MNGKDKNGAWRTAHAAPDLLERLCLEEGRAAFGGRERSMSLRQVNSLPGLISSFLK